MQGEQKAGRATGSLVCPGGMKLMVKGTPLRLAPFFPKGHDFFFCSKQRIGQVEIISLLGMLNICSGHISPTRFQTQQLYLSKITPGNSRILFFLNERGEINMERCEKK
jgi:hypothetical protein